MLSLILIALLVGALTLQQAPPGSEPPPPPPPPAQGTIPERPRVYLDTTYALPAGRTITVPASGDLQAAFNNAAPGDVIVLQAGATFTGNFVVPSKTGTGWIYVLSSALASLPAPGNRVFPAQAGLMPKIVSPNQSPALLLDFGAHHWRFAGIEIATTWMSRSATQWRVVAMGWDRNGTQATALPQLPHNITFDRVYIHGTPTGNVREGITMNAASVAVIDSYLSDFHEVGKEALAISSYNGSGPFKLVNNYLEAAGENVIFGGWDPTISNLVPSDIEIRGNYFFKPLAWREGDPAYAGILWVVKNLLELKNARRVLVDGNVFENNWSQIADSQRQHGWAILFTPRNQAGTAPWSVVEDVTFTNNILRRATAGIQILGWDYSQSSQQAKRLFVRNNLFTDIGIWPSYDPYWTGTLVWMEDGAADVVIDHNTALQSGRPLVATARPGRATATGFVFTNNITPSGSDNVLQMLNTYFPAWTFARNVLPGGLATNYSPDNFFPASLSLVGFLNLSAGDYHLAPASPYKFLATDGRDIGADIDAINAATAGSVTESPAPEAATPTAPTATPKAETRVGAPAGGATAGATTLLSTTTGITPPTPSPVTAPDGASLLISSVTIAFVTSSEAAITWTTNKASDSQIEYGPTMNYGTATRVDPDMVTAHAVILNGLTAGTTYYFRARSKDASGSLVTSSDFTFTTASGEP